MAEEVKLFGMWLSPYARRVQLALKLKGIQFDYIEEDLSNKSPLILKYNPIYNRVPVLVHNGKPIVESLVILEYIDETWKNNPFLPQDPYDRAMARFWAKFIDEKILATGTKIRFSQGKEKEQAIEEVQEQFKLLENELKGKDFFGGDTIGYLDIAAHVIAFWFTSMEWFTEERFPILCKWRGKYQEIDAANECRPLREKH